MCLLLCRFEFFKLGLHLSKTCIFNATMGYIDAKVKASQNRTLEWLNKKDVQEQEQLIFFAIKRGREIQRIRKEREQLRQKEYLRRQEKKKQKKESTYWNAIEKKVKSMVESSKLNDKLSHELQLTKEQKSKRQ